MASIIERTTHFDFFKITVAQGIVIDPRHPEEATVLAFVVDPNQLERFNDQLNDALPGLVEQEAARSGASRPNWRISTGCSHFLPRRWPRSRFRATAWPFAPSRAAVTRRLTATRRRATAAQGSAGRRRERLPVRECRASPGRDGARDQESGEACVQSSGLLWPVPIEASVSARNRDKSHLE